jgi:hypothetical protein
MRVRFENVLDSRVSKESAELDTQQGASLSLFKKVQATINERMWNDEWNDVNTNTH